MTPVVTRAETEYLAGLNTITLVALISDAAEAYNEAALFNDRELLQSSKAYLNALSQALEGSR